MFGNHILITVKNIKTTYLLYLCDADELNDEFFDPLADHLDLYVVKKAKYQFSPYGVSLAYILTTSHMCIHTFPEKESFTMDVFTCQEDIDLLPSIKFIKEFWHITDDDIEYELIQR